MSASSQGLYNLDFHNCFSTKPRSPYSLHVSAADCLRAASHMTSIKPSVCVCVCVCVCVSGGDHREESQRLFVSV